MSRHRDAPYWVHSDPTPPPSAGDDQAADAAPETIEESIKRIGAELEDACPGTCNKRWRSKQREAVAELDRASHATDPVEQTPNPRIVQHGRPYAAAAPVWCGDCTAEILAGIGRLPDLAASCGRRRDGQLAPPPPTERHAPAIAPPSPSPAWDQVDLIVSWTAQWADKLATHLRDTDPALYRRNGFPGFTLTRTIAFLLNRKAPLMAAPFAKDFGRELLDLVERSAKVGGVDELVHHLKDACFACKRKKLERRDGADKVICQNCGRSWPESMFAYLAKHATEET